MNMTKNYNAKDYRKRERKTIKRVITIILLLVISIILNTNTVNASNYNTGYKTNKSVAVKYCKKHYKNHKVKIVNHAPKNHKSKKVIYIERVKTISKGYTGKTKGSYIVTYCKPIKKNKIHYCYMVYNPYTNSPDDIVLFVSNGKVK